MRHIFRTGSNIDALLMGEDWPNPGLPTGIMINFVLDGIQNPLPSMYDNFGGDVIEFWNGAKFEEIASELRPGAFLVLEDDLLHTHWEYCFLTEPAKTRGATVLIVTKLGNPDKKIMYYPLVRILLSKREVSIIKNGVSITQRRTILDPNATGNP